MKAHEVLEKLIEMSGVTLSTTVDTLKAGDDNKEASKIAFCFTATVDVIRKAAEWGADVIITHEPTYHDHFDNMHENAVTLAKKKLLDDAGITLYRYHDHPHYATVGDMIHTGMLRAAKLDCVRHNDENGVPSRFLTLNKPMTAREVADVLAKSLELHHVRIVGAADVKMTKAAMCLGACGDITSNTLRDTDCELVIAGEISEWKNGCFVRDAAELGLHKAMILLGHCGSERAGMNYIRDLWDERYGDVTQSRCFDVPEIFA